MAQIPDSLNLATVEGVRPSTATVAPTDFGLGEAGAQVESAAIADKRAQQLEIRAQSKLDRQAAEPAMLALRSANQDALESEAAAYTGAPGFAADQIGKAKARAQDPAITEGMTPGQKAEFATMAQGETARIGDLAIAHEAKVRAQPIADMRAAQDQVVLNGGITDHLATYLPQKQALLDGYDGSQKGLTQNIAAAFDASAATALATTPPDQQGRLTAHLAQMRTEEIAQASVIEQKGADAYVLKNSTDQANGLINTISSNPLAYDAVVSNGLPNIVSAMPAGLKKDALTEFTGLAAQARVKGLSDQGNPGQALAELNDGRYDAVLPPHVKEELIARSQAALRDHAPKSFDQAMALKDLEARATAETYARATTGQSTGQVGLDEIAAKLSPDRAADFATQWQSADKAYAAAGSVRDMPTAQIQAAVAQAPPQPTDPDYANKIVAWQTSQQAAAAELKARANPGAWAYTIGAKPKGASVAGAGAAQDRGAFLQQSWNDYLTATPGPQRAQAGTLLAQRVMGVMQNAGIPASGFQVVPQTEAVRLASSVINAAPEGKLAALTSLAGLIHDLPPAIKMADGSYAQPQQLLTKQLLAAHVAPSEIAAMVDYGSNTAAMGRYVAALNDPTLKAPLPSGQQANLVSQVKTALKPFLDSAYPLPGGQDLAQARIDRTVLIAKGLMAHSGMNPGTAAQVAGQDMTAPFRFTDTWRMPQALADAQVHLPDGSNPSGVQAARNGAAVMLNQLTANKGANLMAVGGPGSANDQRAQAADKVAHFGRWVTAPDDSGLVLMTPHPDGGFDQVQDRYGRPVRMTWQELQAQSLSPGGPVKPPAPAFTVAPPTALRTPDGVALPAVTRAQAFTALAAAVTQQEGGQNGAVSPKGALGRMQVMPDTVKTYAPRLGRAVDLDAAQNDPVYNKAIGEAALQDNLTHFGANGPGIGLALAGYNAGRGRLDGYTDPATNTWHPGWLQTIGDPRTGKISLTDFVNRIPYPETKAYVQAVLPSALKRLQANH